jgi:hypothetical protein
MSAGASGDGIGKIHSSTRLTIRALKSVEDGFAARRNAGLTNGPHASDRRVQAAWDLARLWVAGPSGRSGISGLNWSEVGPVAGLSFFFFYFSFVFCFLFPFNFQIYKFEFLFKFKLLVVFFPLNTHLRHGRGKFIYLIFTLWLLVLLFS